MEEIPKHILEESKKFEEQRRLREYARDLAEFVKSSMDSIIFLRTKCDALRKGYNDEYSVEYYYDLESMPDERRALSESIRTEQLRIVTECEKNYEDEYLKMISHLDISADLPIDIDFANNLDKLTRGSSPSKDVKPVTYAPSYEEDALLEKAMEESTLLPGHTSSHDDDERLARAMAESMSLSRPSSHDDERLARAMAESMGSLSHSPDAPRIYGTLANCGNSCYMNSSLQLLNSLSVFHSGLSDALVGNEPLTILNNIFMRLENRDSVVDLSTSGEYESLIRISRFEAGRQSDPAEFMNNIFEQIPSRFDFVTELFKTTTRNYRIGETVIPHQYIFNCEYIFDSPSLEDIMARIKYSDGVRLIPNEYFIFQVGRFYYRDRSANYNTNPLIVNDFLEINGSPYIAHGCICFNGMIGSGGHYVYVQFDNRGSPYLVYNDSRRYLYSDEPTFRVEKTGYIFLYKRMDHVGGSKGVATGRYENKYLKYVQKLRYLCTNF